MLNGVLNNKSIDSMTIMNIFCFSVILRTLCVALCKSFIYFEEDSITCI